MSEPVAKPEPPPRPLNYSVLILTLNEEATLPGCLESIVGCDDIVVLDSGSTDRTVEIARAAGARVFVRAFDTFAQQRNFAQRKIPFRYPWVLHLDADERLSPELRFEAGGVVDLTDVDGFFADTKIFWEGKWVRRSSRFPEPQVRLVRAPEFEFVEGPVRAREAERMRMDQLFGCPHHDASIRGEAELLKRHYFHAEAQARYFLQTAANAPQHSEHKGGGAPSSFPLLPVWRFLHRYLLCGGFLDGSAGFHYCRQLARYDAIIVEEFLRLRAETRGKPRNPILDP